MYRGVLNYGSRHPHTINSLENLKVKPRKHDLERISIAIAAYLLGVPITKLGIPPSTIYYYTRKLGVRKRREIRPNCPSCKSDKVIKNGSSRGKTKYKCAEGLSTMLIVIG